ncbi:MAG: hypothetical protein ACRBEQ_02670 [Hyphomonas sp.]
MKKTLLPLAISALLFTACSNGVDKDRPQLVEKCVSEGRSTEMCNCTYDAMAEAFSPELYKKIADASLQGQDARDAVVETLSPDEMLEFGTAMPAITACRTS